MVNWFLKAKHWHLFLLMVGIPLMAQIFTFIWMIFSIDYESNEVPYRSLNFMFLFPIVMIFYACVHFGWFWSMAIGLQKYVPEGIKMKVKKFKIFFFTPLVYILLIMLFMVFSYIGIQFNDSMNEGTIAGAFFAMAIILPLHLFSMFCMFYMLYFTAKTFKTVQLQREVKFGEFVGEFFLLWFYFIGVWIIQPKINEIANSSPIINSPTEL